MSLSLSDLITPDTATDALDALLAFLESARFPTTSWQDGSVPRTLTEGEANAYADLSELVAAIAKGGFLDLAEGDWLTLLAQDFYGLTQQPAVATRGTFRLTDAGGGPHNFLAGELIVTSASGLRYRNLSAGTLNASSTLDTTFEAEATGATYNLPVGASLSLVTSLPTVTVTNPGGVGGWITTQGTDQESDANLRTRCKARWPGTTYMLSTAATYEAAALTASAEVTKVKVFPNDPDPGQVKIVLAGSSGAVSAGAVTDVETYITDRLPLCVNATVESATPVTVTVTAELQCEAAYESAVAAQAEAALAALFVDLPIGGIVYRSALIEALMSPTGMVNVVLSSPASDTGLSSVSVGVLAVSFTVVAVS